MYTVHHQAALTATASAEVVTDIVASLRLRPGYSTFKLPCFRSNLYYDVQYKDALPDEVDHLKKFVENSLGRHWNKDWRKDSRSGCGIIYCRTRCLPTSQT